MSGSLRELMKKCDSCFTNLRTRLVPILKCADDSSQALDAEMIQKKENEAQQAIDMERDVLEPLLNEFENRQASPDFRNSLRALVGIRNNKDQQNILKLLGMMNSLLRQPKAERYTLLCLAPRIIAKQFAQWNEGIKRNGEVHDM